MAAMVGKRRTTYAGSRCARGRNTGPPVRSASRAMLLATTAHGANVMRRAGTIEKPHAADAALVDEKIGDERVIDRFDRRPGGDAFPENAADLAAGRIARVEDAADGVGGFPAQREPSVSFAIEPSAPLDQLLDVSRSVLDENPNGRFVPQSLAGADRVGGRD